MSLKSNIVVAGIVENSLLCLTSIRKMTCLILSIILFVICYRNIYSEVTGFYYEKSNSYKDILPRSDLILAEGQFSIIECAMFCVYQKFCQIIFYKSLEMACSLYYYPLTEFTQTFPESGIEVYKIEGCYRPGFNVIREIDICVKIYPTSNLSYTYAMEVCRQEGGELISLDTDLKINLLSSYLLFQFGKAVFVTVGLDNSSGWKWVNGQPLASSHPNVSISINEYDRNMSPCDTNYCGILSVDSSKKIEIFDNCCNNIAPYFVCSTPFRQ